MCTYYLLCWAAVLAGMVGDAWGSGARKWCRCAGAILVTEFAALLPRLAANMANEQAGSNVRDDGTD